MFHVKHPGSNPQIIIDALSAAGLDLEPEQLDRCLAYWDLLLDSTAKLNLVSRGSLEEGPLRHVGDSLMALARWNLSGGLSLLDVGSGGGLPGIPLALATPDLSVVLLEPKERKADWLYQAIRRLDLFPRVTVRQSRFEDCDRDEVAAFDFVTVRALTPPAQALPMILPATGVDTCLLLWHSGEQIGEITKTLAAPLGNRQYMSDCVVSYVFASINFSSNIVGIREVR